MRRLAFIAAIISAAALVFASTASSDSFVVQHQRYPSSFSFTDTTSCAFPVQVSGTSNIDDALFFDSSGNLVEIHETVRNGTITYSANGKSVNGIGTGGVDVIFNPDGSFTVNTFGINIRVTLPGEGTVILDAGRATYLLNPHLTVLFHAGPTNYDLAALCAALAPSS